MRQLDAQSPRRAENGFALANVDLAIVDQEGLRRGRLAFAGTLVGRDGVRDSGLAIANSIATGRALLVMAVTGGFLQFTVLGLLSPLSQWFRQLFRKVF
jgi:hypothetical protein